MPEGDVRLRITEQAQQVLIDMNARVDAIRRWYGDDDARTVAATDSLMRNVVQLFGGFFGNDNIITKDGELSLFVDNGAVVDGERKTGFVYSLIFHQDRRKCRVCGTTEHIDPKYRNSSYHDVPVCESHEWDEPDEAPRTGTWSFHS